MGYFIAWKIIFSVVNFGGWRCMSWQEKETATVGPYDEQKVVAAEMCAQNLLITVCVW
jgi:hypothetical protein